jgi:hypothetical protein
MEDKDLHEKVLELQDEVCINKSNKSNFIQSLYRINSLFYHEVFYVCELI